MRTVNGHGTVKQGKLTIGKSGKIHKGAVIDTCGDVTIGNFTDISDRVYIITHKHNWPTRERRVEIQKRTGITPVDLVIGEDVFIGIGVIINAIESIGDGAIIGTGSVVTKNIPPYEVWAGNPAKKIKERT